MMKIKERGGGGGSGGGGSIIFSDAVGHGWIVTSCTPSAAAVAVAVAATAAAVDSEAGIRRMLTS
jgi:hypothetical protein